MASSGFVALCVSEVSVRSDRAVLSCRVLRCKIAVHATVVLSNGAQDLVQKNSNLGIGKRLLAKDS